MSRAESSPSLPTSKADESALIARLRAGDELAYETLVREYGGRMLAAARRILASDDDAQDALQDAFISAFKALDTFQGQSQLGTWLHRIAINAALMKLRSQRRRQEQDIESLLPEFTENGHHRASPKEWAQAADGEALRDELRQVVRASIDKLPTPYRVALVLRDIEGLENEQLAEQLGITVNAAKIRVHRARQALRTLLDASFGPSFGEVQP
jgi:RNA polymerase sigma-70 factor (ECF subfamily)